MFFFSYYCYICLASFLPKKFKLHGVHSHIIYTYKKYVLTSKRPMDFLISNYESILEKKFDEYNVFYKLVFVS